MNLSALSQLEERIHALSFAEQLWLIERLAQRIRERFAAHSRFEQSLATIAGDPEIQQELRRVEDGFAGVAADGLDE